MDFSLIDTAVSSEFDDSSKSTKLLTGFCHEDVVLVQIALVFVAGFIAILFCAKSAVVLLIGELLLGFPLGTINTTARENSLFSTHTVHLTNRYQLDTVLKLYHWR